MSHHGFLVGGAGYGHTTTGAFSLLGELHIHLPMILRDQAVVEVVILDLQEDGLAVNVVPRLQEVDHFGGDEHAVAIDGLHCDEAAGSETHTHSRTELQTRCANKRREMSETHNSEWMLSVRRKSCS